MSHTACFEYQTACLRNGHEVADNLGVSDCDGSTTLNLVAEAWNNRSVRTQYIAKSGGDKLRLSSLFHNFFGQ